MTLLSVSLGLFPGDSGTNVFKLSLSILVSVKQWFLLEFRCWVWQMGTGLREHMAEHVGPCFFLQRNLLSFLAALILVSSDRLHLCFLSRHRAWGWQGTSSRVLLLEIFWRRFTFHFSDFIFVVLKKKSKSEVIGDASWLTAISTLLVVVALFPVCSLAFLFLFQMWLLFTFPFSPTVCEVFTFYKGLTGSSLWFSRSQHLTNAVPDV